MPDLPDKLDLNRRRLRPKTLADLITDGSAAPTHTSGAIGTVTPASAEARTDDTGKAPSLKPNTPKNAELKAALDAAQQKIATLEASVATLKRQNDRLRTRPPTTMTWMEAEMKERFSYIHNIIEKLDDHWAQADEERRNCRLEQDKCANEQRAINATLDAVETATGSSRDTGLSQRDVALTVQDEAAVRAAAQALFAWDSANRKLEQQSKRDHADASHKRDADKLNLAQASQDLWYRMLEDFHYLDEQERRRELAKVGAAAPRDHPRFALADPEMVLRLNEERLTGYLECARSIDLRTALHTGVDVPENEIAYLRTTDDPACPYQMGVAVGEMMGWRALCHALNHPEWDHSLNPRKWVWEDFWPKAPNPIKLGFWGGSMQGYKNVEAKFKAKKAQAVEDASFITVDSSARINKETAYTKSHKNSGSKHGSEMQCGGPYKAAPGKVTRGTSKKAPEDSATALESLTNLEEWKTPDEDGIDWELFDATLTMKWGRLRLG